MLAALMYTMTDARGGAMIEMIDGDDPVWVRTDGVRTTACPSSVCCQRPYAAMMTALATLIIIPFSEQEPVIHSSVV